MTFRRFPPSYLRLIFRLARDFCGGGSFSYRMGIWLLLLNVPFGYGGLAICLTFAQMFHSRSWSCAGICCYGMSWGMLGIGTLCVGVEAKRRLFGTEKRHFRAFRRLRKMCLRQMVKR